MIKRLLRLFAYVRHLEATTEGMARLAELHATAGKMEAHIEQSPEVTHWVGLAFAEMVANSENYTEMHFEPKTVLHRGKHDLITVTVQKVDGKTPHQLKLKAEARVRELEAELERLREAVKSTAWIEASNDQT